MAVEREDLRDWHRLFGLLRTDFFTDSPFQTSNRRPFGIFDVETHCPQYLAAAISAADSRAGRGRRRRSPCQSRSNPSY